MKTYQIQSVTDMLQLSREEFHRMLPDLCAWWEMAKLVQSVPEAQNIGFEWTDDGAVGATHVDFQDPETGAVQRVLLP